MRSVSFKPKRWQIALAIGLVLFLIVVLSARSSDSEERLWLKATGWNRAQLIGNTGSGDPAPITLDAQGNIYFFLIHKENDLAYPHVIALDREMETLWDYTYDVESSQNGKTTDTLGWQRFTSPLVGRSGSLPCRSGHGRRNGEKADFAAARGADRFL